MKINSLSRLLFLINIFVQCFLLTAGNYRLNMKVRDISYKGSLINYLQKQSNDVKISHPQPVVTRQSVITGNKSETAPTLDDNFGELLFGVISEKFKAHMKTGVPELLIPAMDPLKLEKILLEPVIGGDPFDINMKNIKIHGLSNFILTELTSKLSQLRFRLGIMFPKLIVKCNYAVNGTLYDVFDVYGTGFGSLEYDDVYLRTTVNLELKNSTLRVTTADPPLVDFSKTVITLKSSDGRINDINQNQVAGELGSLLFWMLADQVVEEMDYYGAKYINEALKTFKVPDTFRPVVTWLLRRTAPSSSPNFQHLNWNPSASTPSRKSPLTVIGDILQTLVAIRPHFPINLPSAIENLRSNFRSNIKRFL